MRRAAKPTKRWFKLKTLTRRDALAWAEAMIPVESDIFIALATRSVLCEVIWALQETRQNDWYLSDLSKIVSNVGTLRNLLAKTSEGRFVSSQLLPVDGSRVGAAVVETLNFWLY